jgi:hypothetical protein
MVSSREAKMKTGDFVMFETTRFTVSKVKDTGWFIARLNKAFFTGSFYDYRFSEQLNAWVPKSAGSAPIKTVKRR